MDMLFHGMWYNSRDSGTPVSEPVSNSFQILDDPTCTRYAAVQMNVRDYSTARHRVLSWALRRGRL